MDEQVDASVGQQAAPGDAPPAADTSLEPAPVQKPCCCGNKNEKSDKINTSDIIMSVATVVIALGTIVSATAIYWQYREMHAGSGDTHTIATAADKTRIASETSAKSATDFATAAGSINKELGDAVGKLNLQAGALNQSVKEATRLAIATEKANANAVNAERPWIGIRIEVSNFVKGGKPVAVFTTTNSGRRPALLLRTVFATGEFSRFPFIPNYGSGPRSTTLELPGASATSTIFIPEITVSEEGLRKLDAGASQYFAFGDVEYEDLASQTKHWTHACVFYAPKTDIYDAGFNNCPTYNETDEDDK
jgi:hypothetical protein